ncbi:D-alanyl-D-alanine carboxypeptidase family protein [Alkalibaculum sp. M08DMB]|uniref:D-alanyl-D-alanine carboxypeptidase family protein n=1 Tax=Alkalibaculum sporogenes TaxID=2655001 RepID=A0A6A7K5D3_9FIRM|nr:M15 family metallopeptidase [Alkalibaculum sporogenes]MPW24353.1 D-alanyl-D-alanine carboxypeptidase family protein [Alkalibaculum sporogenes]
MTTLTLNRNDVYTGNLVLVNERYPLVSQRKVKLIPANVNHSSIFMEPDAVTALSNILSNINCTDEIVPVSGYRSKEEQEQIYVDSLKENGQEYTEKYVALPQCSEHQTGYAVDLSFKKGVIDFICPDFPYDGICEMFRKTAPKYGFVERYQSGKEDITGIAHEPWHFRFVGYPHSEIIINRGLSLEEYIDFIRQYPYGGKPLEIIGGKATIHVFYAPIQLCDQILLNMPEHCFYQVSGNNVDGFIITIWRNE